MASAVVVFLLATPSISAAENGLTVTSESTYTIDPTAGVVHVAIHSSFTNPIEDRTEGTEINKTYFRGWAVAVPRDVTDVVVRTGDTDLNITRKPLEDDSVFDLVSYDFVEKLYYNQSTTVDVTYTLDGAAPRDERNPRRINPAFASFSTWATGDPGRTTLRIVVPQGFDVDTSSTLHDADFVEVDDTLIYTFDGSDPIALKDTDDAGYLYAFVAVSNPDNLSTRDVAVGSSTFQVRAWPDDPEWEKFASDVVAHGVPYLEQRLGSPWPGGDGAEIRESVLPYFNGYSGWFDTQGDIEVGEALDDNVMLHELSHAWFDRDWSDERWMFEGFAQYVAALGSADLYDRAVEPPSDPKVGSDAAAFQDLIDWTTDTSFVDDDEAEDVGYNGAWFVTDAVFEVIGADELARVVDAVGDPAPGLDQLRSWQLLINAAEPITGDTVASSTEVSQLIADYVTSSDGDAQIAQRNSAAAERAALVSAAGAWGVPVAIDDALLAWDTGAATEQMAWARGTIDARDALVQTAASAELTIGTDELLNGYSGANSQADFDAVNASAADLRQAVVRTRAATTKVEAAQGVLFTIGSWRGRSPQNAIATATAALADGDATAAHTAAANAERLIVDAPANGRRRVTLAAIVLVGAGATGIVGLAVARRRRKRVVADDQPPTGAGQLVDASTGSTDPSGIPVVARVQAFDQVDNARPTTTATSPDPMATPRSDRTEQRSPPAREPRRE